MIRFFLRAAFWGACAFTLVMGLLPAPPELPGLPSDKVQHIVAFAVLAVLSSMAYPSASFLNLVIRLSTFGALIELLQTIPALNRDSSMIDWLADTAAGTLVLAAIHWCRSTRQ